MAKLTDMQLIVLSKAAARDDGVAAIPDGVNKPAAAKVAASLVGRKLVREVRSRSGLPVWREDKEGRRTSLVITREGQEAIGIEERENDRSKRATVAQNEPAAVECQQGSPRKRAASVDEPRTGSKQALIIKLLSRKSGATLDALVEATGWLPHTVRAALTGLRKRGYPVVLERQEDKPSLYRIASGLGRAAA